MRCQKTRSRHLRSSNSMQWTVLMVAALGRGRGLGTYVVVVVVVLLLLLLVL